MHLAALCQSQKIEFITVMLKLFRETKVFNKYLLILMYS